MFILAIIRAILLILTMLMYLLAYAVTRIIWPHTIQSAFNLRRNWVSNMCLPILNVKTELKGQPIDGIALYVCNHRSFLDPAIISKYLDAMIIAKAEVADYPIINKGAEVTGVIWVRRESKDSRADTRKAYIDTITNGINVLVFPEGTTSVDKGPLPFKMGTFVEAAKNSFTVVPIALEYSHATDIWTIPNLLKFYLKQASKWSIKTKLTFGPSMQDSDGEALHDKCENWVREEVAAMQIGWSTAFED